MLTMRMLSSCVMLVRPSSFHNPPTPSERPRPRNATMKSTSGRTGRRNSRGQDVMMHTWCKIRATALVDVAPRSTHGEPSARQAPAPRPCCCCSRSAGSYKVLHVNTGALDLLAKRFEIAEDELWHPAWHIDRVDGPSHLEHRRLERHNAPVPARSAGRRDEGVRGVWREVALDFGPEVGRAVRDAHGGHVRVVARHDELERGRP
mmetsp:Transcript_8696/g.28667  ORF Transcript_8696/g.28667 Transcript_8696/m.28667 type:complete len:205 (+) Transcript_8696:62-676(+)